MWMSLCCILLSSSPLFEFDSIGVFVCLPYYHSWGTVTVHSKCLGHCIVLSEISRASSHELLRSLCGNNCTVLAISITSTYQNWSLITCHSITRVLNFAPYTLPYHPFQPPNQPFRCFPETPSLKILVHGTPTLAKPQPHHKLYSMSSCVVNVPKIPNRSGKQSRGECHICSPSSG